MRYRLAFAALTALLLSAGHAHADAHGEALAAFERGRVLRDQAKYSDAVKEFKESVDKEKSVGGYYNLGLCLDRLGLYPAALKAYRESVAIAQEKGDPRAKEALDAVQAVRARTHWVIVNVRDDIAQTPGLRVELDGKAVHTADYGLELFESSSEHTLKVAAKDYEDLVIHPPDRQPFTVDKLGKSLVAVEHGPGEAPEQPTSRAWGWEKWTAIPLLIGGAVGIGFGIHYSLDWADRKAQIQDQFTVNGCGPGTATPVCTDLNNQFNKGKDDAIRENAISYSVGGVLVIGSVFLFALGRGDVASPLGALHVAPSVGVGRTGMTVLGSF
jgi:hypothetical protein